MTRLRRLAALQHDERGVSAVEFALLAPVLATLILGIIDLSTGLSHRFTLQQAVNRSLEIVQANRVQRGREGGTPDYDFLRTEVAAAAGIPVADVTLTQWRECDGARATTFEGSCPDRLNAATNTVEPADTARYIQLRATRSFTGKVYAKRMTLQATSSVRVQ
jgi:Flp pilus assembly protein TadG